jgi:RimJ/RimL family protein N-acetyltransferase
MNPVPRAAGSARCGLRIRPAAQEDALEVLRWRNDELARVMSRQTGMISQADHLAWFGVALKRTDIIMLVGELSDSAVGVVRFDQLAPLEWEVSTTLAPEARGRKLSPALLRMAIEDFFRNHPSCALIAEVKGINEASLRLFKSLGFVQIAMQGDLIRHVLREPHARTAAEC